MFVSFTCSFNEDTSGVKITEINQEEVVKLKEVLNKMPQRNDSIPYRTKDMGFDDVKDSLYTFLSYEEKCYLNDFFPIQDPWTEGIISINKVCIFDLNECLL